LTKEGETIMNTNKLITLASILVGAIAGVLLYLFITNREPSKDFFTGISEQSIHTVILKDMQDWVKLERKGDVWVMIPPALLQASGSADNQVSGLQKAMANGGNSASVKTANTLSAVEFPVDSAMIAQLLENIVKMQKTDLISDNPAKQATFDVDTNHGCQFEAFDAAGKSFGKMMLGKSESEGAGTYCRMLNSNSVYRAQGVNRYAFFSDHKRWTDKAVMKFEKASVKQIALAWRDTSKAGKGKTISCTVARGDSVAKGWQIIDPVKKTADSNKVNEILNTLSNLQAAEYEDSAYTDSAAGLKNPAITIAVTFTSGTVRTISIGSEKAGQGKSWFKIPEKPYLYLMNDDEVKRYEKKPDDLIYQPPKPEKPASVRSKPTAMTKAKNILAPVK
jgi:hypothetical protein